MEDEDEGLCEEERALKPLVPARVTACDATGAAGFWANSVPTVQRSEKGLEIKTAAMKKNILYDCLVIFSFTLHIKLESVDD